MIERGIAFEHMVLARRQAREPNLGVHPHRIEEELNVGALQLRSAAHESDGGQRLSSKIAGAENAYCSTDIATRSARRRLRNVIGSLNKNCT
jgi:hypothetical protein